MNFWDKHIIQKKKSTEKLISSLSQIENKETF